MTIPELHRRIERYGLRINLKSLYRLNNEHQPLQRLDLRVAGAICQVCEVSLSELVGFDETGKEGFSLLPASRQERLDALMAKNNEGKLTVSEQQELNDLVNEAEAIMLHNARILARQKQKLVTDSKH